jgi:uncharacterized protein (TIGR00661 family)
MARIWYSVLGDGMGHAIRSYSVIEKLRKDHELIITAADKAYPFLKKLYGKKVVRIEGNAFIYKDNKAKIGTTIGVFLVNFPHKSRENFNNILRMLKEFRPDLLISDFEPASHYFSLLLKIPCISLDNIHVLTECKGRLPRNLKLKLPYVKSFIKFLHPKSDYYILPAFANLKTKNPRKTKLVKPIIREKIRKLKPRNKGFVLVYQTSPTNQKMLRVLAKTSNIYKIYGMKKRKAAKNIEFKDFSEKKFLDDLKNCSYVIINGGFTVISEALYLGKPILSIPVENQFEQEFNAYSIKDKGYGDYTKELSFEFLKRFEPKTSIYRKNIKKLGRWSDNDLEKALAHYIKECLKKKPRYELLRMKRRKSE